MVQLSKAYTRRRYLTSMHAPAWLCITASHYAQASIMPKPIVRASPALSRVREPLIRSSHATAAFAPLADSQERTRHPGVSPRLFAGLCQPRNFTARPIRLVLLLDRRIRCRNSADRTCRLPPGVEDHRQILVRSTFRDSQSGGFCPARHWRTGARQTICLCRARGSFRYSPCSLAADSRPCDRYPPRRGGHRRGGARAA